MAAVAASRRKLLVPDTPLLARWNSFDGTAHSGVSKKQANVIILPLGDWQEAHIQTRSGHALYFSDPDPKCIELSDISYGLSFECRYANQAKFHYSVGQHSVLGARYFMDVVGDVVLAFHFLFHDATEAYMKDLPTDLKRCLPLYKWFEQLLWKKAIAPRFDLSVNMDPLIKDCDNRIVVNERPVVLKKPANDNVWKVNPSLKRLPHTKITRWTIDKARKEFEKCFRELAPVYYNSVVRLGTRTHATS